MLASFVNTASVYSLHSPVSIRVAHKEELLRFCDDTIREYYLTLCTDDYQRLCDTLTVKVDIGRQYYLDGISNYIDTIKESYKLPKNFYIQVRYDSRFITIVDSSFNKVREKEILDSCLKVR